MSAASDANDAPRLRAARERENARLALACRDLESPGERRARLRRQRDRQNARLAVACAELERVQAHHAQRVCRERGGLALVALVPGLPGPVLAWGDAGCAAARRRANLRVVQDDDSDATLQSRQAASGAVPSPLTATLIVVFDGAAQQVVSRAHLLDAAAVEVGRRVEGVRDVALGDPRVSRRHAVLRPDARHGVVRVEPVDGRPVGVNGLRVTSPTDVRDNDILRFGDTFCVVRFRETAPAAAAAASSSSHAQAQAQAQVRDGALQGMRGDAPAIAAARRALQQLASSGRDLPLLLLGESGTGKEVAARAYAQLVRPSGPFVDVNCGAIPETLAESTLFGHVAGAFTGAVKDSPGVFRRAHGGTLFLDEVGELPPALQSKLLRALEQREVAPVGGKGNVAVDVRVVAATNRDLAAEVARGAFRGDLYARLAGVVVRLPPLRERREDALSLVAGEVGDATLEPDLVEALLLHSYPYNAREAMKLGGELAVRGQGRTSLGRDLFVSRHATVTAPLALSPASTPGGTAAPRPAAAAASRPSPTRGRAPAPSREELMALLAAHGQNVTAVARATGRSRMQVYRWLKKHGLDVADAAVVTDDGGDGDGGVGDGGVGES